MGRISDLDKNVFAEAASRGDNNFTPNELSEFHAIALRVREILDTSKTRQERFLTQFR